MMAYGLVTGHNFEVQSVHAQDALVPGLTRASVQQGLAERFGVDSDEQLKGRTMAGWYLQQVRSTFTSHC